jgi:uncharacterized BrkB/YihY/UPF0761 family membrane protein
MSFIDYFAWFVLIFLLITAVAVLVVMAMAPGHIAKSRNHPWAQAVEIAGWVTLIFGLALWPLALIWAYVDVPKKEESR